MTREERNVLIFVATGVLVGSWPLHGPDQEAVRDPDSVERIGEPSEAVVTDLFPIDLNTASPELLAELPGIGPVKAEAIVERRRQRGPYRTVDELEDVRGIGPKTVDRLRARVSVGPTPGVGNRESIQLGERTTGGSPP